MARDIKELQKRYGAYSPTKIKRSLPSMRGPGPSHAKEVEKPKNASVTIKRLLSYLSGYRLQLITVLIMLIVSTLSSLIGSYMLFPIINRIARVETTIENSGKLATKVDEMLGSFRDIVFPFIEERLKNEHSADILIYVFSALIILASVYIIGVIATYVQQRIMLSITQGSLAKIRDDLFGKLQTLPVEYFDTNSTGDIMSRFTNDVDRIETMFSTSLIHIISGVIAVVVTLIFMITTNWILTIVTVVFAPIMVKSASFIAHKSRKHFKAQQVSIGSVNGYIEETVSGQKVVKVFNHENECEEEFVVLNDDLREKQFRAQFFGGIMGPVLGNTSQISYGVTIGIGGILMATAGLTPGALTVFAQYARRFSFPVSNISQQMTAIFSALAGAERVFNVMDTEPEALTLDNAIKDKIEGEVVLKNVTFGYDPEQVILKNISLYAKNGQKIAFVGSTGAGKTTITNLLNRFYEIDQGEILIDGKSIYDYDRDYLRQNIAMVLQDTHLFTGTVMENIRYGRLDATDEEVIEAAKTSSAHSFIMRLSDGYQTVLEGDGANLSQGQRQLINIARAAMSKAPILVLDEATSSVDTRTEKSIQIGMDRLMRNRTTFVIAHRLSTVRNSNAIMVLEKGEIIERGTHEQLLEMQGRYYELYTGIKELD
ncbi:MAG: ABC transporter ATP-binding protein [Methanolobus sp.]|nr:ABC transporter ATP-binding protein [Methanolobus sp.]